MRNAYQEALNAQNACNLWGLATSLPKMIDEIRKEPGCVGSDAIASHPVVVLMLAQMVMLSTGTNIDMDKYSDAYGKCLSKAVEF